MFRCSLKIFQHPVGVIDMLDRITPQWLAGFFDGEGSVACYRGVKGWKMKVTLTQKDEGLLSAIRTKFPEFCFYPPRRKHGRGRINPCFEIVIDGGVASVFLEAIRPFVIRKLLDVEVGIQFSSTIQNFRKGKKRTRLTEQEHKIRTDLVEKLHEGRLLDSIN